MQRPKYNKVATAALPRVKTLKEIYRERQYYIDMYEAYSGINIDEEVAKLNTATIYERIQRALFPGTPPHIN